MLYGYFVQNDAGLPPAMHTVAPITPCVSYWDEPTLEQERAESNCSEAPTSNDVAFSIASFSGTPVETIRAAIGESRAFLAPADAATEPAGLAAVC